MNSKSVAFHHFGCKVNFAEASTLSRQFQEKGFEICNFHDPADIYVISSCIVTAVAEKKCRAAIRQAHKQNPKAKIAVIGCFPELKPEELSQMEGVDLVLGHTEKFHLLEELENLNHPIAFEKNEDFIPSYSFGDRTRSFLKIQDGCDYYCTYCTIPLARGRSRSDTIGNIVNYAHEIAGHDINEIVLTGVNIGDFGTTNGESFLELIRTLDKVAGISRFRISSIEPDLLNDDIIEFVSVSEKFLPHFHIPLQSGCNKVLRTMHRKYGRELYESRIMKIRSLMPFACIAADVIVGFPGENEEDFKETLQFIRLLDISYLHVFTYSKRDNTLAAKMGEIVHEKVKKQRSELLHALSNEKKKLFYLQNQGRIVNVLYESDNSDGYMHGFSENYLKVKTSFNPSLVNKIKTVKLVKMDDDGCWIDETNLL
ncbi:MAG: tRNA (N(6)-L-threonylcarbamoyladenosine(37)-C(2))-methylthiotransferase MtaB [Bacteroidales bacterium]|jgi:threonylcarbamoyladenosine tRNA methylthiotransferase MtaB|nr:tRNA (N(6)-L-threonylcarbamoyladenosine(37)-C(2))-methylthiotransferase MtaB [Bacteroidales bacterium]